MKRHLKRYFTNGLNTDTAYENKISSSGSDIRGSITEVELVMNNYRGCSGLNKNPVEFMDEHCKYYLNTIGILLPKLFWPTVRKKCSSDRKKLLKFEAEGREFSKFLRSLEHFIQTVKGQNNLW